MTSCPATTPPTATSAKRPGRKPTLKADGDRTASDQFAQRDKLSLDIFWLKDESIEDSANLEDPDVIAAEIIEVLRAALEEFEVILRGAPRRQGALQHQAR
jgi:type I restriction enzyme M protein